MKNKIILLSTVLLSNALISKASLGIKKGSDGPSSFISISSGYKSPMSAFGIQYAFPISEKIYVRPGIGAGLTGIKVGADIQSFSKEEQRGFAIGAGIGFFQPYSSGSAITDLEINNGIYQYSLTVRNTVFAGANIGYHWKMGKNARFFMQSGFNFGLRKSIKAENINVPADDFSLVTVTTGLVSPNGWNILGLGFSIKL
jgi:hypothetical protein